MGISGTDIVDGLILDVFILAIMVRHARFFNINHYRGGCVCAGY